MLVMGVVFNCLDPVLTIAAALSINDIFNKDPKKRSQVTERKNYYALDSCSDFFTVLHAY